VYLSRTENLPSHVAEGKSGLRAMPLALNLLVVVSVLLNAFLTWRVLDLSKAVAKLKTEESLAVNAQLPVIDGFDVDGQPARIAFAEGGLPTILYVLRPDCKWCARNSQNIKALADAAKGKYRVIGISLSSQNLKEYLEQEKLSFPVYTDVSAETRAALHLGGTPQTIVASPEGRVLKNWMGAYMGPTQQEVEKFFNFHLPGLAEQQ
jgi:hypothetical protein